MKYEFTIWGKISGGKDNIGIAGTGHRYPLPAFAEWRDRVIRELRELYPNSDKIEFPCRMAVKYWNKDLKRRDVPAMIDAILHCLERGGFVKDDELVRTVHWSWMGHDRENGRAEIALETLA